MKKYLQVAGILGAIALVCAALIAVMNLVTAPIIKNNEEATIKETYTKIYEDFATGRELYFVKDEKGYIQSKIEAKNAAGEILGYIYTVDGKNSYGEVSLMIGISNGRVVDVEFLTNTESFASTVNSHVKTNYPSSKEAVIELNPYGSTEEAVVDSLDSLDGIDVKCGATYGATLVKDMVNAALAEAKGGN